MAEAMDLFAVDGDVVCKIYTIEKVLQICWCKKNCLLGQGAYGHVYKGKWKERPKARKTIDVAVKVAGPYHIEYEIASLKKANGHRNILKFYDQVKYGPNSLIVTELCDGTLHDLFYHTKNSMIKLTPHRLKNVVLRQIVEGVKHLHDNNIFHRDLKPHNILYYRTRPLVMKVADFDCSRSLPQDATHYTRSVTGTGYSKYFRPFGTKGWLAPEVLNGAKELRPPHAVDIYPLGLLSAYTLCLGKHPYGEDATARDDLIKNKQPMLAIIRQQLMELGDECYDLVNWMLNPNPEGRPTAAEILEDDYFFRPIIRDPLKENELLQLCQHIGKLEDDDMTRFLDLITDEEAVDINCADKIIKTPLLSLCCFNQSDSLYNYVEILLQKRPDIDVNQTDKNGRNALMLLCGESMSKQTVEVAQLLIANGADVKQMDKDGMNALMRLCQWSTKDKIIEMAQLLIKNGIDVKKREKTGRNALMLLCRTNSRKAEIIEVAQLLIGNGVEVKKTDKQGKNALMYLCETQNSINKIVQVAQLFIDNGIDLKQTDKEGRNAEYYLTYNQHPDGKKQVLIDLLHQQQYQPKDETPFPYGN